MKVDRRKIVRSGLIGAGAAALSGCGAATRYLTQPDLPERLSLVLENEPDLAWRVLNRAAFGPRPGDVERVRRMGVAAYLEEQLRAQGRAAHEERFLDFSTDDTPAATWRVRRLDTLYMSASNLYDYPKEEVQKELQQAAVLRAVYSRWQLREVMAHFWDDHFNVSQTKSDSAFLRTPYEAQALRRHALGSFRELLGATARSPAMLYYLDNARNARGVPNENYARELMELHTLGVEGGYTQKDVFEVARCFTGWAIKDKLLSGGLGLSGGFEFRPGVHDPGDKQVLGSRIAGRVGPAGQREGEEVLDLLAAHASTARFLGRKLCRRFVADDPPEALVSRAANAFQRSGGQVAPVLRAIFASTEFRSGSGAKMKRPFDFVISSLRAVNADTDGAGPLRHLELMGQLPYHWAMPNGYPDRTAAWAASMLGRWNFALALATGQIPGTSVDLDRLVESSSAHTALEIVDALASVTLGRRPHAEEREALLTLARAASGRARLQQVTASLLASPGFQWR